MTLAIFDLDNTLIAGDSDHLWGEFLCDHGIVDGDDFPPAQRAVLCRLPPRRAGHPRLPGFRARARCRPHTGSLANAAGAFIRECIEPILLPAADALIASHRDRGHRLLIITATNEFVTAHRPAAGHRELLGCSVEVRGRRVHRPGHRHAHLSRGQGAAPAGVAGNEENEALDGAWFYSDSHNDLPLLEQVANPVLVDPDETFSPR
jgi:phosphoserine phosphatase